MLSFFSGKFAMSSPAMKVAAQVLRSHSQPDGASFHAVMAGLRKDNPYPLYVLSRDKKKTAICLSSSLAWLSGDIASGSSQVAHAWQKASVRAGYRSVYITMDNSSYWDWSEDERHVLNLTDIDGMAMHDIKSCMDAAVEQMNNTTAHHLHIQVPNLSKANDNISKNYIEVASHFGEFIDNQTRVFFKDTGLPKAELSRLTEYFRELARKADSQVIVETKRMPDISSLMQENKDDVILMRQLTQPPLDPKMFNELTLPDFTVLKEGQGYHWNGRAYFQPIEAPYDDAQPDVSGNVEKTQSKDTDRVVSKIEEARRKSLPKTHMECLEIVARACGYRNWHAAEGRRSEFGM